MKAIAIIGITIAIFAATSARELPEFLHVCKKTEPKMGECIKNSVINFKPYLKTGLPEYNIPSLEPLALKELVATAGGNIKMKLRNVNVYGASNFTLGRIKANMETLTFIAELRLPHLAIDGEYDVDGLVILLRIRGSGPMSGNFDKCKATVTLQMEPMKGKDGEDYLKVSNFKTKIYVGAGTLTLQNLFGGDPVLGEAVNVAINSNFDSFIKEIEPSLESAISNTFTQIANSILSQFTYQTLFPDS